MAKGLCTGTHQKGWRQIMAIRRLTIQIKDDSSNSRGLNFSDFLSQLSSIREALLHLEKIAEPGAPHMQYRLVDLRHQSPATVVIEIVPHPKSKDLSAFVSNKFVEGIKAIKSGVIPDGYDYGILEVLKNIGPRQLRGSAKMVPIKNFSEISITTDSEHVDIEQSLKSKIDTILGPDETSEGSIAGMLEVINIHSNANSFKIYPNIGPNKVDCVFKQDQLQNAIAGINRFVSVTGTLCYKRRDKFPYAINDAIIEVLPDESELPTIFDLKGIAPNATGNIISEDFVATLRYAEK